MLTRYTLDEFIKLYPKLWERTKPILDMVGRNGTIFVEVSFHPYDGITNVAFIRPD